MSEIDINYASLMPHAARPPVSIVIPVLNEAPLVMQALSALADLRARGCEIILVDGGSDDDSFGVATRSQLADRVLSCRQGRARQMNEGARAAGGTILLFLHVDTRLPADADRILRQVVDTGTSAWGRFDVHIEGRNRILPVIAFCMNLRSRLTGIATGDQAMFVTSELFERVGGFPLQPLMEDIAMSRVLKRIAMPLCLRVKVVTSGRRWEQGGAWHTILLMWRLRLAYFLGISTERLARSYERQGRS